MRRAFPSLVLLCLALACAGSGCGSEHKDGEAPVATEDTLRKRLEKKTGVKWKVDVAPDGTVYAEPEAPPRMTTPATLIAEFGVELGLVGGVTAVREGDVRDLADGVRAHEYYQMHDGVSVEDGSVEVHLSKERSVELVIGRWIHGLNGLSTKPAVAKERAEQIAYDEAKATNPWLERAMLDGGLESGLVIYSRGERPQLVYRVSVDAYADKNDASAAQLSLSYVIDAQNGAIVSKRNRYSFDSPADASGKGVRAYAYGENDIKQFAATKRDDGIYTMVSPGGPNRLEIRIRDASKKGAPVIESTSPTTWDERPASDRTSAGNGSAVDAIHHVRRAARYFDLVHEWRNWGARNDVSNGTGTGKPIHVYVHEKDSSIAWAWYNPADKSLHFPDVALYEDGTRIQGSLPGTAAVDIVGHEFGHGFVAAAARDGGPAGDGEQGALSEAFADLIGVAIAHDAQPDDVRNWQHAANASRDGRPSRDLRTPSATGSPSHLTEIRAKDQYHANGVIIGYAFRLMALGGIHPISNVEIPTGIGWPLFEKLVVAAVRTLRPTTGFGELAWNTIRIAKRKLLIPVDPVVCSWVAVGVISAQSAKSEHGVDCTCSDPVTGLPFIAGGPGESCCNPKDVACCKKCDDSLLGTWQGDWGKISFANVNGEIRASYTYREGIVLAKGSNGVFEGCWSEEPTRKDANEDIGAAQFSVKPGEGRIDGQWNFRSRPKWRENWDVKWVGPTIPPTFKYRMEDEKTIATCR